MLTENINKKQNINYKERSMCKNSEIFVLNDPKIGV